MKIAYIIPDLSIKGGIQQFAKSVKKSLDKKYTIHLHDYPYSSFSYIESLLNLLPDKLSAYLFIHIISYYHRYKLQYNDYDIFHFWHIVK